jgi:ATP-dependent RNA helicase DeaD
VLLVPPRSRRRAEALFREAGVRARFATPPTPEEIRAAADERLISSVRDAGGEEEATRVLAERLLAEGDAASVVASLLSRLAHGGPCAPRRIPAISLDAVRSKRAEGGSPRSTSSRKSSAEFVIFQVSWGARMGADPRRLLALVCRRGRVSRTDIGAIHIARESSTVEVAAPLASKFEDAVRRRDPRDPHVRFRRWLPPEARQRAARA